MCSLHSTSRLISSWVTITGDGHQRPNSGETQKAVEQRDECQPSARTSSFMTYPITNCATIMLLCIGVDYQYIKGMPGHN